jgi:hypothetical protein
MTLVDQAAADETHPHIAAYSRAMYRVSPLAGSAGLHVIAPVAILLTLALIAVGAVRPLNARRSPPSRSSPRRRREPRSRSSRDSWSPSFTDAAR